MMRRIVVILVLLCGFGCFSWCVRGQESVGGAQAARDSAKAGVDATRAGAGGERITHYTLTPEREAKARALAAARMRAWVAATVYGFVVLLVLLWGKVGAKFRDLAERTAERRWVQGLIFAPLIAVTIDLLMLPVSVYDNWIYRVYGLSVQSWGSWAWDWLKGEFLNVIGTTIVVWVLYWTIRKAPRTWWFYFWIATMVLILGLVFVHPLIIDPMFNKFEPLQAKDPGLTLELEKMARRAGVDIPPERMFWMRASEKTTELNAYVTGFGASKRIVVWDTTIAKMNTPQIVFVAGHEMGHYVLNHIPKGLGLGAVGLLITFYVGYRLIGWMLARWGDAWGIRDVGDLASFPALILVVTLLSLVGEPIGNSFSRYFEHQADQYGLEVTHGLTPDSSQVAAQSFNILGDVDLADPAPGKWKVVWFYTHPAIPQRISFALSYNPWRDGGAGEFVK
jgi:STE24 endopeptidase